MNTTADTTIDNSGSVPVTTSSEVVATPTIAIPSSGGDVDSIMRKMADQQNMIANLSAQLETKSNDVEKLSQKQRDEMMHVYQTVIKGWVDARDSVDPKTREEFNNGIANLAKNADDNGIWYVHPLQHNTPIDINYPTHLPITYTLTLNCYSNSELLL
jgi:hypothetical protein